MKQAPENMPITFLFGNCTTRSDNYLPSRCMQNFVRTLQSDMTSIVNAGMCFDMKMYSMY